MEAINQANSERALNVLVTAFKDIPGALWVVKQDKKVKERLRVLCAFCLNQSVEKGGAFITSDQKGVSLIYDSRIKDNKLKLLLAYIRLGYKCIGWNRSWNIIKRERTIVSRRPKTPHLYFWMLAVEDYTNGLNTIIEMRDFVFKLSKENKLSIYAETTVARNLTLYKRYGFEVYDTWETGQNNLIVWFLKRPWQA